MDGYSAIAPKEGTQKSYKKELKNFCKQIKAHKI
jgi:hypothetical protein